jgi:hypothetical protein
VLALGSDHRDRDPDVVVPHALFGPQAEVDLLGERDRERVALERGAVGAGVRLDGSEVRLVPAGRRAGELGGAQGGVASRGLVEPARARESPGAVDEHPDADAVALGVAQVVDVPVLRDHVLAAQRDGPCVRVRRTGAKCRIDRRFGQLLHGANPNPIGVRPLYNYPAQTSWMRVLWKRNARSVPHPCAFRVGV